MKKRLLIIVIVICLALSACVQPVTLPAATESTLSARTTTPPEETPEAGPRVLTPEDIVYSFLTAYEDNPDEMTLYLSDSLKESLPEGGISKLLGFHGTMEGLVFQSGAGSPDQKIALVEARLQIDQQEVIRRFTLHKQNDTWVITAIEQTQN